MPEAYVRLEPRRGLFGVRRPHRPDASNDRTSSGSRTQRARRRGHPDSDGERSGTGVAVVVRSATNTGRRSQQTFESDRVGSVGRVGLAPRRTSGWRLVRTFVDASLRTVGLLRSPGEGFTNVRYSHAASSSVRSAPFTVPSPSRSAGQGVPSPQVPQAASRIDRSAPFTAPLPSRSAGFESRSPNRSL